MSRKASKRVSFSPDINDEPTIYLKHNSSKRIAGNRKRFTGICNFQLPKSTGFSPMKLLWRLSAKVARAVSSVSMRRKPPSSKVSSSNLGRSRSYAAPVDSHRTEAIKDCIEFINSSSCFQRSNSASAST